MNRFLAYASLSLAATLAVPLAHANTLATFPLSSDTNASYTATGITATLNFSNLDSAAISNDGFGSVLEAYPSNGSTDASLALSDNSYFTLTLDDASGTLGDLQITVDVGKGGSSDPRGFAVYDGSTLLQSNILPSGSKQAPSLYTFDVDATGDISQTLDFYVWSPNPAGNSVDFQNLNIASVGATPEPSSLFLLGTGMLALAAWKIRQAQLV